MTTPDLPVSQRRYLNLEVSSDYVGISINSLRRLIAAGKLIARRPVRGRIVLDRLELEQYISTCTAQPRTGRGLDRGAA